MKNVFYLTTAALDRSNAWSAIKYSSNLLDVERKIATNDGTSLSLAHEQWKVEVWRFFDTSLALMQGRAYDIAREAEAQESGVINALECCAQQTGMHEMVMEALLVTIYSTWVTS
jgi:hypothetical protein